MRNCILPNETSVGENNLAGNERVGEIPRSGVVEVGGIGFTSPLAQSQKCTRALKQSQHSGVLNPFASSRYTSKHVPISAQVWRAVAIMPVPDAGEREFPCWHSCKQLADKARSCTCNYCIHVNRMQIGYNWMHCYAGYHW